MTKMKGERGRRENEREMREKRDGNDISTNDFFHEIEIILKTLEEIQREKADFTEFHL